MIRGRLARRGRARPRLIGFALAVASGVLLTLASEPFAFGPVAWVALVPAFVAAQRAERARLAAAYGFVSAAVYFGAHLVWIFLFGWMAWSGLTIALSLYPAAAFAAARAARRYPSAAPVVAAGFWVAFELLRDFWPFGGYAWGALGTSQASVPGARWLAGSVGAYGLSFLCAFSAAVVATRIVSGRIPWAGLGIVAGVLVPFVAVDAVAFRPRASRPLGLVVVQGSVPRPVVAGQDEVVFENHVRLTRRLAESGVDPDVVVWPESAAGYLEDEVVRPVVADLARTLRAPMLVGRTRADYDVGTFDNAVEFVDAGGELRATYSKRHAVPFGERVPLAFLRGLVTTLQQVPLDMRAGTRATVFEVGGARIATPICFESVFPRDVRAFVRAGAEIVVVSTNDASFERSFASEQHLAHARMRALESRQWVVQAAISGVSAVVRPDASVHGRTELFRPAILDEPVRVRRGRSVYVAVGDLFSYAWSAVAAAALVAGWRRRSG